MHPDRVHDIDKKLATEKFQLLAALYAILCSKEKRELYDEKGFIDEEFLLDSIPQATFKITNEHIKECKEKYKGNQYFSYSLTNIVFCIFKLPSFT